MIYYDLNCHSVAGLRYNKGMALQFDFKRIFYDTADNGATLVYNVERLWILAQELPVQTIPLSQVESELDYAYCWFKTKQPTPRAVARHAKLIYEADFSYPIILSAKGIVMDGMHRIAKAWLLDMTTIQAVQFVADPAPDAMLPPALP